MTLNTNEKVTKRYNNIDLLRFIFAVLIVMFHFSRGEYFTINQTLSGLNRCNVCVDFFFIISGFFLFNKINLKQSISEFAIKRFLRLAPLVWVFLAIMFISSLFIKNIHFSLAHNILRMLLLHDIGFGPITGGIGAHVHWFVSAIFWVSLFYYYLAKLIDKKYLDFIVWIITICSLGLYLNWAQFGTGGNVNTVFGFINIGIIRGIFGIGIGYFISNLYNSGFLQNCTRKLFVIITIVEGYLVGFFIHYLIFTDRLPSSTSMLYFVSFSILFYLFLIKKGLISNLLNRNFGVKLGAISYAIYIIHPIIPHIVTNSIHSSYLNSHKTIYYFLLVTLSIIAGIFIHLVFEKPINAKIKTLLRERAGS